MTIYARFAALAVAALVFALLIWFSFTAYSPVPLVDGWPVYSRLMQYILGEVDLKTYLLAPHGSHPHSIVYALYRVDLHYGGRQIVPHLVSVASIAAMAVAMAWWVRSAIAERGNKTLADLGAAAALVLVPNIASEVLAPFQVVLTFSRLAYAVLIVAFVWSLRRDLTRTTLGLLVASAVAVTFHGSGVLFAVVVFLQHLIIGRRWSLRMLGAVPLVASLTYTRIWVPTGAGELAGVSQWLGQLSPAGFADFITASFAYYVMPIISLRPDPNERVGLIPFGALIAVLTIAWALFVLVRHRRFNDSAVGLAFVALFVGASAASAALLWESRRVLGMPGDPVLQIMIQGRYAAVAVLAYAIALVPLLTLPRRFLAPGLICATLVTALPVFSSYQTTSQRLRLTDTLDQAAAALFAGAEITDQPAEFVWPGVAQDWYWPAQLVKVVDFATERRIGFAYGLPPIGSKANALWQSAVQAPVVQGTSVSGLCSLAGTIPPIDRDLFSAPHFLGVADASGTVIGAVSVPVATDETKVTGFVRCPNGPLSVTAPEVVASGEAID